MIEPKKIEPNFFIRWLKKSIILTLSNIIPWLIFDFFLFLLNYIPIKEFLFPELYLISLGVVFAIISFNLSLYSNEKLNILKDKILYKKILENIFHKIFTQYMIMVGLNIFMQFELKGQANNLVESNISEIFYWGLAIFGLGQAIFTYFFMCYYQIIDMNIIEYYIGKSFQLNPMVKYFMIFNGIILSLFLKFPIVIYFLFPIFANFWFVGFKEIFTENKEKETVEEKEEEINSDVVMN
jgi:hypothetical protein